MLADFAQVYERKLFISGAGINVLVAKSDADGYVVGFYMALTIRATNEDEGEHQLRVSILDRNGRSVSIMENQGSEVEPEDIGKLTGRLSLSSSQDRRDDQEAITPFAFGFSPLRIPQPGSYQLITEIGPVISSIQFDVMCPKPWVPDELTLADP